MNHSIRYVTREAETDFRISSYNPFLFSPAHSDGKCLDEHRDAPLAETPQFFLIGIHPLRKTVESLKSRQPQETVFIDGSSSKTSLMSEYSNLPVLCTTMTPTILAVHFIHHYFYELASTSNSSVWIPREQNISNVLMS